MTSTHGRRKPHHHTQQREYDVNKLYDWELQPLVDEGEYYCCVLLIQSQQKPKHNLTGVLSFVVVKGYFTVDKCLDLPSYNLNRS